MARTRQKSIVSAGASASAASSAAARDRSPSSRCASASAMANSVRRIVMSDDGGGATNAGRHSKRIQRPSGQCLVRAPGSPRTTSDFRDHGSTRARPDAPRRSCRPTAPRAPRSRPMPLGANRPNGSCQQDSPSSRIACRLSAAAFDPSSADKGSRGPEHVHVSTDRAARGRSVRPPARLFDELHEPTAIDQEMAPGEVDHRVELADGDGRGIAAIVRFDGGLTAALVEACPGSRRGVAAHPSVDRRGATARAQRPLRRLLEPSRRTSVQIGQSAR